jgi:hypothetical protein
VHPKVAGATLGGTIAGFVLALIGHYTGWHPTADLTAIIVMIATALVGWLVPHLPAEVTGLIDQAIPEVDPAPQAPTDTVDQAAPAQPAA